MKMLILQAGQKTADDLALVYWVSPQYRQKRYSNMFVFITKSLKRTVFAGGIWNWKMHCAQLPEQSTVPSLPYSLFSLYIIASL